MIPAFSSSAQMILLECHESLADIPYAIATQSQEKYILQGCEQYSWEEGIFWGLEPGCMNDPLLVVLKGSFEYCESNLFESATLEENGCDSVGTLWMMS